MVGDQGGVVRQAIHRGNQIDVEIWRVASGEIAVWATRDGEPYARISINCDSSFLLGRDQFFCKNYSENEGLQQSLVQAKVILPGPEFAVRMGWVTVDAVTLHPEVLAELDQIKETL